MREQLEIITLPVKFVNDFSYSWNTPFGNMYICPYTDNKILAFPNTMWHTGSFLRRCHLNKNICPDIQSAGCVQAESEKNVKYWRGNALSLTVLRYWHRFCSRRRKWNSIYHFRFCKHQHRLLILPSRVLPFTADMVYINKTCRKPISAFPPQKKKLN